jgi:hypothetical protein
MFTSLKTLKVDSTSPEAKREAGSKFASQHRGNHLVDTCILDF